MNKYIYKLLSKIREKERELNEEYTKQTAKILMNFILLKIYDIKEKEIKHLYDIGSARVDNFTFLKFWFSFGSRGFQAVIIILLFTSLWYFGKLYLSGEVWLEIVMFVFFLIFSSRRSLMRFADFASELAEQFTYIGRFDEVLEKSSKKEIHKYKSFENLKSNLIYRDIYFRYDEDSDYLLEKFSLEIPYGQKLSIVGRSGSGKSTLFKLLTKLLILKEWNLFLEDKTKKQNNIKNISFESIYKHIWYFYQEPLVFDWTIRENISLNTKISDEELKKALKLSHLEHLNLDTVIWENWTLLSGWEKQRLALARVFLFDYDIILLDEPTSNLDLEIEKEILLNIFEKNKDKTIVVVSHRPFILEYVDRIIVMKKWMIVDDGRLDEVEIPGI